MRRVDEQDAPDILRAPQADVRRDKRLPDAGARTLRWFRSLHQISSVRARFTMCGRSTTSSCVVLALYEFEPERCRTRARTARPARSSPGTRVAFDAVFVAVPSFDPLFAMSGVAM